MENKTLLIILAVVAAFALFIAICSFFRSRRRRKEIMEHFEKVHIGMTKDKTIKTLGKHYKKKRMPGNVEKLEWHFKSVPKKGRILSRKKLILVAEFKRERVIRTEYLYR